MSVLYNSQVAVMGVSKLPPGVLFIF